MNWRELVKLGVEFPHEPRAMGGIMMGLAKAGPVGQALVRSFKQLAGLG
jgi:hypothetical protein